MTLVHTLSSGSSGNALLLSCGESHLLLDAGISCRRITAALGELGLTPGDLTAILITHTHADHIAGLQTLLKRCGAPVFATGTAARDLAWRLPAAEDRLQTLDTVNGAQTVGDFAVTAFPTSHDAPGACGFRLDTEDGAVGVLTDTGCVTDEAAELLPGVDLAVFRPLPLCAQAAHPRVPGASEQCGCGRVRRRSGGGRRLGDRSGPPEP